METKDFIYSVGIFLTLAFSVWNLWINLRVTRRTSFINTVTNQRIQWIEQLRQDIAAFSGLTHTWCYSSLEGKPEDVQILKEVDRLRHVILLRLNPDATHDNKISQLIRRIPELTDQIHREELNAALNDLTTTTQLLLKQEWEKVKAEAKDGDLKEK